MDDVLHKTAENKKARGHLDPSGFDRHVQFHTYAPPPDLAPFIEHFWTITWDHPQATYMSDQVMHRPQVDVFISEQWSGVQGTFKGKRTYTAEGKGRIIGMRFLPGAFHLFWQGDMSTLEDTYLNVQDFSTSLTPKHVTTLLQHDDQFVIQALADIVRQHLPQNDSNVAIINTIIAASEKDLSLTVSDIAATLHRSERWLQQLFQTYVGIGLKWLLQRNKLLFAAKQIRSTHNPQWTAIAYDAGYSSQQHFITDFKKVTGKTPVQYKNELES